MFLLFRQPNPSRVRKPVSQRTKSWRPRLEVLEELTLPSTGAIYWTERTDTGSILKANLDGTGSQTILTGAAAAPQGAHAFSGIALDESNDVLYAGDANALFRANLDGSNRTTLVNVTNHHPQMGIVDVELDLMHGKVYWTNGGLDVSRANLDGSNPETVLSFPLGGDILISGLAVDPVRGKLFYDDFELVNNRGIYSANLDGSNPTLIVDFGPDSATTNPNHSPMQLAVDVASGKLYWNDSVTDAIYRVNEDGTGAIDTVAQGFLNLSVPLKFDAPGHQLYFVEDATTSGDLPSTIKRVNPDGTGIQSILTVNFAIDHVAVGHGTQPSNTAPQVNAGPDQAVAEGSPFAAAGSFTDADSTSWTATVDYGDSSGVQPLALNPDKTFNLSHAYTDNGSYTVTVSITDNQGATGTDTVAVTVTNVPPSVSLAGAASGVRGQTLAFAGGFTDPGTADTWTATVDFGDGSGTQALSFGANHAFSFNHVFTANGTYSVVVTVRDDDGGAGTASQSVTIRAVALQQDPIDPSRTALVVGGTTGDDAIQFIPWGFAGDVAVFLDGTLYTTYHPTGHLIAYGQAGNDYIQVFGLGLPAFLDGGDGNDVILGGFGDDVYLGGRGNDVLIGGSGRDLMIGGAGADWLFGGGGEDILIAGTTAYDSSPAALGAVMREWTRTDRSYAQRVADLRNGGGLNGGVLLSATTVFSDPDPDNLVGGPGLDWFLFDAQRDRIADLSGGEIVDNCPIIHP